MKTWKSIATRLYHQVERAGLWTEDMFNAHYSGAGGAVHPNGCLMQSIEPNDVAWEELARDCRDVLDQATKGDAS